jgi:hypothetical protein
LKVVATRKSATPKSKAQQQPKVPARKTASPKGQPLNAADDDDSEEEDDDDDDDEGI